MAYSSDSNLISLDISLMDFSNFSEDAKSRDNHRMPLGSIQGNHLQHSRSISSESESTIKSGRSFSKNPPSQDLYYTPELNSTWKAKAGAMHKDALGDELDFAYANDASLSLKSSTLSPGPMSDLYTSESSLSYSPFKLQREYALHQEATGSLTKEAHLEEADNQSLQDPREHNSYAPKYSSELESEACFSLHEDAFLLSPNSDYGQLAMAKSSTQEVSRNASVLTVRKSRSGRELPSELLSNEYRIEYLNDIHEFPSESPGYSKFNDVRVRPPEDLIFGHPTTLDEDNVQVILRIRPLNTQEVRYKKKESCLRQVNKQSVVVEGGLKADHNTFTFDHVAGETVSQEEMFNIAGLPMIDHCLSGYNSTLLTFGQTGSGKTYTMTGPSENFEFKKRSKRGLIPRIFEKLFVRINEQEELRKKEQLFFSCKCSFVEIYNEHITDLLDTSRTNLQIRSDPKTGQQIEGAVEVEIRDIEDVYFLLKQGCSNRKIASTNLNKLSSRSHSVFSCSIQSTWVNDSVTNIRFSRLNLVDLAGSERQSNSGASGPRLKEASSINKSLHHLGHVIMILSESQKDKKERHVPYRDSKLTYLLQDSLGGNSKTTLIATVSTPPSYLKETLSTLRFAQRAKFMQNKAVVNEDMSGEIEALKEQIKRLKEEVRILYSKSLMTSSISKSLRKSLQNNASSNGTDSLNPTIQTLPTIKHEVVILQALLFASIHREKVSEKRIYELEENIKQLQRRSVGSSTAFNFSQDSSFTDEDKSRKMKAGRVLEEVIPMLLEEKNRLMEEITKLREEKRWREDAVNNDHDDDNDAQSIITIDSAEKVGVSEKSQMVLKSKGLFSMGGCFPIFSRTQKLLKDGNGV